MYLSRLILNPRSRRVQKELAQPYELHRTMMQAFPDLPGEPSNPRERFGILFRVDMIDRMPAVLVQSTEEPDWQTLADMPDYLTDTNGAPNPAVKDISDTCAHLREGQTLSFRLRANPTKRSNKGDNKGKRVGLYREEEQTDWLARQAKRAGFSVLQALVVPEGTQEGRKQEGPDGPRHQMKHHAVRFEGVLRIADAQAFRQALASGIGPAKAFGFGLLSLAPA